MWYVMCFWRMYYTGEFGELFSSAPGRSSKRSCKCDLDYSGNSFAYVVNSKFVFQDKCETLKDHIRPFCKFVGARGVTMVIEVAGVWFFAEIIHMNDMAGKFITQFVVLALNYIFSKFLVFTSGRKS